MPSSAPQKYFNHRGNQENQYVFNVRFQWSGLEQCEPNAEAINKAGNGKLAPIRHTEHSRKEEAQERGSGCLGQSEVIQAQMDNAELSDVKGQLTGTRADRARDTR